MILRESHIASDGGNILVKVCEHSLSPEDQDLSVPSRAEIELVRILSGVGTCVADLAEIDAQPGDLFVFPGHAAHSFHAAERDFRFAQIRFDPRFIWDGAEGTYDFRCVSFLLRPTAGVPFRLPRANPANAPVRSLMERIDAAVSEEDAPLLEIVRLMRQTYELFKLRDAGEINQGLQEQICDHFISFINQLSFSRSKQKDDNSKTPESGKENQDAQNKNENADDEKTLDASAPGAGEKTSDGESQQLSDAQAEALKRRIWGELPPEIQQAFPIDTKPIPLPGYQEKINRYWKELEK